MLNDDEIWKDIEGYEEYYQVSSLGRVRSLDRVDCNNRKRFGMILKQSKTRNKIDVVVLSRNNESKNIAIKRLVAKAFIPNPYNLPDVTNKDGDLHNNKYSNLVWVSRTVSKIKSSITRKNKGVFLKDKNPKSKKIICVNTKKIFNTIKEVKGYFNINSVSGVSNCCCGRSKSCGKHPITGEKLIWMYYEEYCKQIA